MNAIFIPLRKVDEATRTFYAWIDETPDHAREILDYASAKPAFQKWSDAQHAASQPTGGNSFGNVRAMHGKIAAGVLDRPVGFDDANKRIEFWGKVTDDEQWTKVCTGTYTGVSPGGGYAKRWADPSVRGHMRYTPIVAELSLVDKPCIPSATFQYVKADGVTEDRELVGVPFEPGRDAIRERAEGLAKAAGSPKRVNDFVVTARSQLISENAEAEAAELAKLAIEPPETTEADVEALEKALADARAALEKKDAPKPYGDVEYADAKAGKYPIDTAAHIRAAWSYINMPKNASKVDNPDAVKAKIVAAWKAKIDIKGPPSMEKAEAIVVLIKAGGAGPLLLAIDQVALEKGFYTVQRTAGLLAQMSDIASSVIWEERYEEDDDSTLPQSALNLMAATRSFLVDEIDEECSEFFAQCERDGGDAIALLAPMLSGDMELSAKATDLAKLCALDAPMLEKIGRRMSSADSKHVQATHDHAMALGAKCDSGNCDDGKMAKVEDIADLAKARRMLASALPTITDLTTEVGALRKAMADQASANETELADLRAKLEKLGAGPGPAKGVLITMDKGDDQPTDHSTENGEPDPFGPAPTDPDRRIRWAKLRNAARGDRPAPGGSGRQY